MGQTQFIVVQTQSIVRNSIPYVWIQEPGLCNVIIPFIPRVRFHDRLLPNGLIDGAIDGALWKAFSSKVDSHMYKLNVGMRFLAVFLLILSLSRSPWWEPNFFQTL